MNGRTGEYGYIAFADIPQVVVSNDLEDITNRKDYGCKVIELHNVDVSKDEGTLRITGCLTQVRTTGKSMRISQNALENLDVDIKSLPTRRELGKKEDYVVKVPRNKTIRRFTKEFHTYKFYGICNVIVKADPEVTQRELEQRKQFNKIFG